MNDFSGGPQTADRLRHALEDSRLLRAQLKRLMRNTHALVDVFNTELRTYVSGQATGSVAEATGRSAGSCQRATWPRGNHGAVGPRSAS